MYIKELSFDDFIEIEIQCEDTEKKIRINTKVDSVNNQVLKAVVPKNLLIFKDIDKTFIYYKAENKCKRWECEFLGFEKSKSVFLIVLSCNLKGEDVNSRDAFRIPYDGDMVYYFDDLNIKGRYKDISATGVGFYSNKDHKLGDKVAFTVEDLGYSLDLEGEIVRKIEQRHNIFKFLYGVRIKRENEKENENEKVMAYVFKKQIEIIRKRKGMD